MFYGLSKRGHPIDARVQVGASLSQIGLRYGFSDTFRAAPVLGTILKDTLYVTPAAKDGHDANGPHIRLIDHQERVQREEQHGRGVRSLRVCPCPGIRPSDANNS